MKKALYLTSFFALLMSSFSAQTFWTEEFQNSCTDGCVADTYAGPNGAWTINDIGGNGVDANQWFISGAECGNDPGLCGSTCGATDPSLHIGSNSILIDPGAAYLAGGLGYFFPETDRRVESPVINCTGFSDIELSFNYIEGGQTTIDDATLWYFDGTAWSQLDALAKTIVCPGTQGQWTAFTIDLPASADNNANVQLGFRWVNNDDNIGDDPSFAVDDMALFAAAAVDVPTAIFELPSDTICAGDMISFTDMSTSTSLAGITDWDWTFGSFATSTDEDPVDVLFSNVGSEDITLTVTDEFGESMPLTLTIIVEDCSPMADFIIDPGVICNNQCISFMNNSITEDPAGATYNWDFANTNTSIDENPADECYPTAGTFTISLTITDSYGTDTATQDVTVNNCVPPTAAFTPSETTICLGDCISFLDESTSTTMIDMWNWTFQNASISDFNGQDPGSVCYDMVGVFDVTLEVTDASGSDELTIQITVNDLPVVTATSSETAICSFDSLFVSGGGADTYVWDNGALDGDFFTPPIGNTTFTVTGTDANMCSNTASVEVEVIDCQDPVAAFSASSLLICEGDCIDISDLSENADTWEWSFGTGATPANFSGPNPPLICYDSEGDFEIQLIVSNLLGSDTTSTNITVNDIPVVSAFDEEIDLGLEVILSATTDAVGGTYQWTPADLVENPNDLVTSASPEMTTDFIITVTDDNGCMASDTATVTVIIIPGVGVPTGFSPNGDGDNDDFGPLGEGYTINEFLVYNRYGQQVFQTNTKKEYWDGKFNGKEQNPGVYFWYFSYTWFVGPKVGTTEELSGQITLIK